MSDRAATRRSRGLALDAEYLAATTPHRERIRELRRLIAIEELHIEKKSRAVLLKREGIVFLRSPAHVIQEKNEP